MENFSFPEAALLLQHCAEIYGRKVDYVYNLAVELCENMNVLVPFHFFLAYVHFFTCFQFFLS